LQLVIAVTELDELKERNVDGKREPFGSEFALLQQAILVSIFREQGTYGR
jgi:hypothetical protein